MDTIQRSRFYRKCSRWLLKTPLPNSPIAIDELENQASIVSPDSDDSIDSQGNIIRQLQLANLQDFPLVEFLSISFTHHIRILENTKDTDERLFYIRYCHNYKPTTDEMEPELLKVLPPKEELQRIFEESGNKDGDEEGSED